MPYSAKVILKQALELPAADRAAVIEGLISSLDRPDASLDSLWVAEAESRLTAYRAGEMEAFDADEVFSDLEKHS